MTTCSPGNHVPFSDKWPPRGALKPPQQPNNQTIKDVIAHSGGGVVQEFAEPHVRVFDNRSAADTCTVRPLYVNLTAQGARNHEAQLNRHYSKWMSASWRFSRTEVASGKTSGSFEAQAARSY